MRDRINANVLHGLSGMQVLLSAWFQRTYHRSTRSSTVLSICDKLSSMTSSCDGDAAAENGTDE